MSLYKISHKLKIEILSMNSNVIFLDKKKDKKLIDEIKDWFMFALAAEYNFQYCKADIQPYLGVFPDSFKSLNKNNQIKIGFSIDHISNETSWEDWF